MRKYYQVLCTLFERTYGMQRWKVSATSAGVPFIRKVVYILGSNVISLILKFYDYCP